MESKADSGNSKAMQSNANAGNHRNRGPGAPLEPGTRVTAGTGDPGHHRNRAGEPQETSRFAMWGTAGHRPTHLDGHKHLHLLPQLGEVLVRLARRYSIGVVRLSREPGPGPR